MAAVGRAGLVDPRLVKVRAGERGSGWAVGARGVLTARHVVGPFLDKQVDMCLAVPSPAPGASAFGCDVIWQDVDQDLALLAVNQAQLAEWALVVGPGLGPPLAEPGTGGLSAEAVGYPDATVEHDYPNPDLVLGWLRPPGGAVAGLMPFDVDGSVPDNSLLWQGMSGAAVRDRPHGRLLGVVIKVDKDRQQRRLYVRPLPDPAVDAGFSSALIEVGAKPVLEAVNAPDIRRLLAVWDQTGRPPAVREVPLDAFGARKARTDIDTHGNPYYPYVGRHLDSDLATALDRRASGTETRVLLLVGEAMTGKSRTGAHALQVHPALSARPLLVPQQGADLRDVIDLAPAGGAVLWLDDLQTFAAGLSQGAVRYWQSRPDIVAVATLRSDLLSSLQGDPSLRPAWTLIDDEDLVEQFPLPTEWSAQDQEELAGAEDAVRGKVADGIPLGEVLAAAQELRDRLEVAEPFQRALAFTVIDWARTGLTLRLPETEAEELWVTYLSHRDTAVLKNQTRSKRHDHFLDAVDWACAPIPGTAAMLVARNDDGLLAEDYLVAQRTAAQQAIAHPIWQAALRQAQAADVSATIFTLGFNAANAEVLDIAREAWEPLAVGETEEAPMAARNLGVILKRIGDLDGARAAFQRASESDNPQAKAGASISLAILLEEQGDLAGARAAYQKAIDSDHPQYSPQAAFGLGRLQERQEDVAGARAAYQKAIDSDHPEYAPAAAIRLGDLLSKHEDVEGAKAAYQAAVDTGEPYHAINAALGLALELIAHGDKDGGLAIYRKTNVSGGVNPFGDGDPKALDSGYADRAPEAAFALGNLLADEGDPVEAKAAYQKAIDSGHSQYAPRAEYGLGTLLLHQGDKAGAKAAYQKAADSDDATAAPWAELILGMMLAEEGKVVEAKANYQKAIDSGHPDAAPAATYNLGLLQARQEDTVGAKANYQKAIDSGHTDHAPAAEVALGRLLAEQGDTVGAQAAYQKAIDSGHTDHAPAAEVALGRLLAEQGDVVGAQAAYQKAKAAYQKAIGSGITDHAVAAEVNLGLLLITQGDAAGGKAAFQKAIDSDHPDYAPVAMMNLAELYAAEGDLRSAKRLLGQASSAGLDNAGNYLAILEDHECDPVPSPPVEAVRVSAEAGDTDSMNFLGLHALRHGSHEEARSWWTRSAAAGDALAALLIAQTAESK
jgi:TolA-binding protein